MYTLRNISKDDYEFIYELNKTVNKENVEKVWGSWDEDNQREFFKNRFDLIRMKIIKLDDKDVGILEVEEKEDELYLEEIQILPEFQGKGLGTRIIRNLILRANKKGKSLKLRVLKINPAKKLYERLGFSIVGDTETHYIMRIDNRNI